LEIVLDEERQRQCLLIRIQRNRVTRPGGVADERESVFPLEHAVAEEQHSNTERRFTFLYRHIFDRAPSKRRARTVNPPEQRLAVFPEEAKLLNGLPLVLTD